jgi:hypothetical protein
MADITKKMIELLAVRFKHDPLAHVKFSYPWGEGPLKGMAGPRTWQRQLLEKIGEHLRSGATVYDCLRIATSSGRGIGKSALVAWIILWAMSTMVDTRGIVTAETAPQLKSKTWPELAKWYQMAIWRSLFEFTATSIYSVDAKHRETWRFDALPWNEQRPTAFAGLHNLGKRELVIMDEASEISDNIWDVINGSFTDLNTEMMWFVFGNPTSNSGYFRECFGSQSHRWLHRQIDSRDVEGANLKEIEDWIATYREDSDYVRVHVKGEFPHSSSLQFIPSDIIAASASALRVLQYDQYAGTVVGVDVARFGTDESVIATRKGMDARTFPMLKFSGIDTMQLAGRVIAHVEELRKHRWGCDAVMIDESGVGGGVIDRVRQIGGVRVIGVNNGAKSDVPIEGIAVSSKGAECWARMREWLRGGGAISTTDPDLKQQLEGREYGFNSANQIVLEKKDDMKRRGLQSPDRGDALALTHAYPILSALHPMSSSTTHCADDDGRDVYKDIR